MVSATKTPAMNMYDVYSRFEVTPVRGEGSFIYDDAGKEYLDFYGGHAVISVGHTHPHYVARIQEQISRLGFYSNSIENPLNQELADNLSAASGVDGYSLFLINSGAEANENALKLASFYQGRQKIVALKNSFHGRTSAVINVTHTGTKYQSPINKMIDVEYCDIADISHIVKLLQQGDVAGIIIEAIQGIGGLDMMSAVDLQTIRKVCDDTDTIMILDEVQCGYGRSGDFFAFQKADIRPDIITMAKGMGNGFPIGGVLIDATKIPPVIGRLGTTYGGNHLACAAGIAVLEIIQNEQLTDNALKQGNILREAMSTLPGVKQVKGRGLMLGAEFDYPVADLRKHLVMEQQLFTGSSANPNLLRILPALNITEREIDIFIDKLTQGLQHQ